MINFVQVYLLILGRNRTGTRKAFVSMSIIILLDVRVSLRSSYQEHAVIYIIRTSRSENSTNANRMAENSIKWHSIKKEPIKSDLLKHWKM